MGKLEIIENLEIVKGAIESQKAEIETKALNTDNTRLTTAKDVTGAINELFTNANDGKTLIANVVGSPLLATDTFQQEKNKIQILKNTLATNLTNKQQSSSGSEALQNLVNKVANISTGIKLFAGDDFLIYSNSKQFTVKNTANFTPYIEFTIKSDGFIRISHYLRALSNMSGDKIHSRIYVNDIERSPVHSDWGLAEYKYTDDIAVKSGDRVSLYLKANGSYGGICYSFEVRCSTVNFVDLIRG